MLGGGPPVVAPWTREVACIFMVSHSAYKRGASQHLGYPGNNILPSFLELE